MPSGRPSTFSSIGQRKNPAAAAEAGEGVLPLTAILRTEELQSRYRPVDHETECRALTALTEALADSPRGIFETLVQTILKVLRADSAGISLLTEDEQRFYWPAIAGAWQPHLGGGTPRNYGPCGDVIDRGQPLLFSHWERRYPYLREATPLAEEGLLVPFFVRGKAVGTIWAIAHDDRRKFDQEDVRQLESLGRFASGAHQVVALIEQLEQQKNALQQSHDKLASTLGELRNINADLEQFAYSASHDLSEPIRTIAILSELLSRFYSEALDQRGRDQLAFIGAAARRLEVLVRDLLIYTRTTLVSDGKATRVNAAGALDKALADLDTAIREAGAKVTHDVLPAVLVRETQLEQLFQNLIGNAIKYRRDDEPARIHVGAERQGAEWLFFVRDNGIGIPPEYKQTIFGLFKRLHSEGASAGSGIGLSICKRIVERSGGRIWVESEGRGHGAVFYFTLPMGETETE